MTVTSETINGIYNKLISRSYDTLGRSSGMNIGTEYAVGYGYDNLGRFSTVTNGADTFTYGYLPNSNLISGIAYPNTISVTKSYESNRDLITSVENKYGTTTVSKYDYSNDDLGRRTAMGKLGTAFIQADTIAYGYNDKSEVTSAVAQNQNTFNYLFNFDGLGNRITSTSSESGTAVQTAYTANNLNQYSLINDGTAKTPSYDFDGNTLSVGDGWVYEYNGANRMVKATNGSTVMEFEYDYAGREISRKKTEGGTVTSHIRYVWDGMNKIEELDALDSNAITKKYVLGLDLTGSLTRAGGVGALLSETALSPAPYSVYPTYDVNGNVTEYIDSTGTIQVHYEYSPFGKVVLSTGPKADDFSYRFSTKEFEANTGLVLYQFRAYNPIIGRFLSRDPIGEEGGVNFYSMVSNDPVGKWDRLGFRVQGDFKDYKNKYMGKQYPWPIEYLEPSSIEETPCSEESASVDVSVKFAGTIYTVLILPFLPPLFTRGYSIKADIIPSSTAR